MAKKNANTDKPKGYAGRSVSGDQSPKPSRGTGERNVGKKDSEEHSRVPKGKRG